MVEKTLAVKDDAIDFAVDVYGLIKMLPQEEKYALGDQLRRASVSIASNIAEGSARGSKKDFAHFLRQADGSLQEVKCQITIAVKLGYIPREEAAKVYKKAEDIGRQLGGLIRYLTVNNS